MKAIIILLALSFVLLLPHDGESGDGRWKLFGKSMSGTLWYLDTETMTRPVENIVAVWVKSVPDKAVSDSAEGKEETETILKRLQEKYFGEYGSTDGLWELDCSKSLFRLLYFCVYDKNGDILTSSTTPDAEWSSILPGSAGETLFGVVCVP